eukprot:3958610-Prymnesium_polylepis.1
MRVCASGHCYSRVVCAVRCGACVRKTCRYLGRFDLLLHVYYVVPGFIDQRFGMSIHAPESSSSVGTSPANDQVGPSVTGSSAVFAAVSAA